MATLLSQFGPNLGFAGELASLTSYNTGGRAKYLINAVTIRDIVKSIKAARQLKIPYFLLGGGSNVLVSDKGFNGLVIKVDVQGLKMTSGTEIQCGAGVDLMDLVNFATENSVTGMEFAAGIWGTVGGAIYGNAGAYGSDIGSVIRTVTLVDQSGDMRTESAEYCKFGYRDSNFKTTKEIVVEATIGLENGQKESIQKKVDDILQMREGKHPVEGKSAGCFFKNVPDSSQPHGKLAAGKLLEEAGAKQLEVGGAKVYEKHANIIVNTGKATSSDIRRLADIMKKKVIEKFGIELEEEVVQIGDF